MCLVSHHFVPLKTKGYFGECLYKEGTEYFEINNNNKHEWKEMFFCMKAPCGQSTQLAAQTWSILCAKDV